MIYSETALSLKTPQEQVHSVLYINDFIRNYDKLSLLIYRS